MNAKRLFREMQLGNESALGIFRVIYRGNLKAFAWYRNKETSPNFRNLKNVAGALNGDFKRWREREREREREMNNRLLKDKKNGDDWMGRKKLGTGDRIIQWIIEISNIGRKKNSKIMSYLSKFK